MKNVTIALDDEIHRKARIRAAELGTSLSALVKDYLNSLVYDGPMKHGVREMQMPFNAAPFAAPAALPPLKGPEGQPYFVNGQWVYTKDGKPRKPGAMRHLPPLPDNWDEWPAEMEEYFEKLQTESWDENGFDLKP